MNEKNYKKRLDIQQKTILRQSEYIDSLKSEVENLRIKCKEKDELINSVSYLRDELAKNVDESKKYKEEYKKLVEELNIMKSVMDKTIYKSRWKLIKFLIK